MAELYALPDGWEWKEFSKVFNTPTSKPYQIQKTEYLENGLLPIIDQGKEFIIGYTNLVEKKYSNESNCIIFGDHTRQIKYVDFDFVIGADGTKILKEKDKNKYDLKFLYFQFLSKEIESLGYSRHFKLVKEMFFAIPSLDEQKRIVAKLDILFGKIDKAIALHQKNIDEANVFMASVLNDVFVELEEKYSKIIFDEVCNKITDGSHNPPKGIDNSQFMMLSSKNILNNSINFENPRYLKEEDFNRENKRTDVTIGDVLLTIVGTIGRTAVVNIEEKFTLQRSVAVLKPKKDLLNPYFLMYSLQKNLETLTDEAKGAAQKGIYLNSVKKLEIVDISLKTQQKTVSYLDEISQKMEKIKQIQKEKMQSLKALKASILDQAFKGEL